jgi:hypothetical protein
MASAFQVANPAHMIMAVMVRVIANLNIETSLFSLAAVVSILQQSSNGRLAAGPTETSYLRIP